MTVTKRKYEEAEAESRAADREITALWLEYVKPAQDRYERDPRVIRAARRRDVAKRTVEAYKSAHPREFPEPDYDDDPW